MNMATWNKAVLRLTAVLLLGLTVLAAAAQVPPRPDPPRLVNDFAGILGDCQWLEDSLEKIAVETSNQICVVTMDDLGGYDKAMMAYSIGQQWGVGTQRHRNGVVILVKPKTADSKGDAFIATGYGLEGGITDAACRRIVDHEMIPHFKENDYLGPYSCSLPTRAIKVTAATTAITVTPVPGADLSSSHPAATGVAAARHGAAAVPSAVAADGAASVAARSVAAVVAAAGNRAPEKKFISR